MREERRSVRTAPPVRRTGDEGQTPYPTDVPVFAVREWAARFHEQQRLRQDAVWWRLAWPFAVTLLLGAGAAGVAWRWPLPETDWALGAAVVLAAAAIGTAVGGLVRLRAVRVRLAAARSRPATVEDIPAAARAVVLDSPRIRFRRPTDGAGFAAVRDAVAATVPVGGFAAAVLVWALVMQGRVDGSLEDWVRGRRP